MTSLPDRLLGLVCPRSVVFARRGRPRAVPIRRRPRSETFSGGYGCIGTDGTSKTKAFASAAEAEASCDKLIAQSWPRATPTPKRPLTGGTRYPSSPSLGPLAARGPRSTPTALRARGQRLRRSPAGGVAPGRRHRDGHPSCRECGGLNGVRWTSEVVPFLHASPALRG